jgi:hypothetical protein
MKALRCAIYGVYAMILLLFISASSVPAQQVEAPYVPGNTTVAILPVVDLTGITDKRIRTGMVKAAAEALNKQFTDRGFKTITDKPVEEAVARLKIDLTDVEQHKRAVLLKLGQELGTDLIAFVAITDATSEQQLSGLVGGVTATVKIKCWLLDVKTSHPLLSAHVEAGDSVRWSPYRSTPQATAVASASNMSVTHVFERALKLYPVVKKGGASAKP